MGVLGAQRVGNPIPSADGNSRVAEADGSLARDDVDRFLVGAMEMKGEGPFTGSQLEELATQLLITGVRSEAPAPHVELPLAHFHRLDLILVHDVRVCSG